MCKINDYLRKLDRRSKSIGLAGMKPVSRVFGFDRGTPIDRFYIETFLRSNVGSIRGNVLEIGDRMYTERFGGGAVLMSRIMAVNGLDTRNDVLVVDLTDQSTLPESEADCFICTQTFNFIFDVKKAVAGAHHVLKPGGVLLATMAGVSQISRYDMDRWGDYWRFTTLSAKKMFGEVFGNDNVAVESYGNVLSTASFLYGLSSEELRKRELEYNDPDYQLVIAVRAVKATAIRTSQNDKSV